MKKSGFTLAEVLITLGIVGVIAALTIPMLVSSSRNQANASKLSATISSVESALTSAIAQDGVDDIYETDLWINGLAKFGDYVQASLYDGDDFYADKTVKQLDKTALETNPSGTIYQLKSGAVVFFSDIVTEPADDSDKVAELGGALHSPAATVMIDVNGTDVPNIYGRDIFYYKLGDNGHLYPYGGRDVSISVKEDIANVWDADESDYPCVAGSTGLGCAARLMAEGYKMNY